MRLVAPWALFLAFLVWGWRVEDLFHAVPAYGDVLEVTWGVEWVAAHFPHRSLLFYPLAFHPQGWHVATFAYGPLVFLFLLPLYGLGNTAFAYNAGVILSLFVAYGGMFCLARRLGRSLLAATVAAILFTFWGFRWARIYGHVNILLGSALLPWMAWCLERASTSTARRWMWLAAAGGVWASAMGCALYFVWLGGLVWAAWGLIDLTRVRERVPGWIVLPLLVALAAASPVLLLFAEGHAAAGASFYDAQHLNHWGANLNSLPIPFVDHPWLRPLAEAIYRGPQDESGVANLGLLASLVALLGVRGAWRGRRGRAPLLLAVLGLVLALGFTLKWNGGPVPCAWLQPLNAALWDVGHRLKPALFRSAQPPPGFAHSIPLPGLLVAVLVPFWEGARVLSRFALAGGVGVFLLVAWGLERVRWRGLRALLALLLLLEVLPPPSWSVPFPPPDHPAFAWVRAHTAPGAAVLDLYVPRPGVVALPIRAETLWATRHHRRPAVAGSSAVWPAHTASLNTWLVSHPHPFREPGFVYRLHESQAHYILLHVQAGGDWELVSEAEEHPALSLEGCFDPPAGLSPWPYPMCVLRIELPSGG